MCYSYSCRNVLAPIRPNELSEKIYQLPYNNNPQLLANKTSSYKELNGKFLFRRNIEIEAYQLHIRDKCVIMATVNHYWDHLHPFLQEQFNTLAEKANVIILNKRQSIDDTLNRISRLGVQQITRSVFEENFFNGVNINNEINDNNYNNVEFLLRPGSSFI